MAFEELGKTVVEERELGWEDTIVNDGMDFILLPEGDYDFTITEFQRERHNGSEKLPPCNKAVVTLRVTTVEGDTRIKYNLFLHSRTEGMVSAFFVGIGLKKHGEPFKMNWNQVVGRKGRAKISIRTYNEKQYNEIKKIYDPASTSTGTISNPAPFQPGVF